MDSPGLDEEELDGFLTTFVGLVVFTVELEVTILVIVFP